MKPISGVGIQIGRSMLFGIILLSQFFQYCSEPKDDSGDNEIEQLNIEHRNRLLGIWSGSYECSSSPDDSLIIISGPNDLDVLVLLHYSYNKWSQDTVSGTLIRSDYIEIPSQTIGGFPGSGKLYYDAEADTLKLVQSGFGINCIGTYSRLTNHTPQISDLFSDSDFVGTNEITGLHCLADDRDGEQLSYQWEASMGTITGNDSSVIFTSPDQAGSTIIKCTVMDSAGATDTMQLTLQVLELGTLEDIDGNLYQTVSIGDQVWMAENLRVTHFQNGTPIPTGFTTETWYTELFSGGYTLIAGDSLLVETYGVLYNGYAVLDSFQLAPAGWHIASDDDWKGLELFLGIAQTQLDSIGWRGSWAGAMLKDTHDEYWVNHLSTTNEFGFTALPAGKTEKGWVPSGLGVATTGLHDYTYFWTTNQISGETSAFIRSLSGYDSGIYRGVMELNEGLSVRCVKD